jgi:hypothetical protein
MSKSKRPHKPAANHPWKRHRIFTPTAAQILLSRSIYDFMPADCFVPTLGQALDEGGQSTPPTRPKDWATSSMRNFMSEIDLMADEPPPWEPTVTVPRYLN